MAYERVRLVERLPPLVELQAFGIVGVGAGFTGNGVAKRLGPRIAELSAGALTQLLPDLHLRRMVSGILVGGPQPRVAELRAQCDVALRQACVRQQPSGNAGGRRGRAHEVRKLSDGT